MIPDWPSLVHLRLFYGRDRAETIGTLAESMGTSRRTVEKAVEALRARGEPICSGRAGIWISRDPAELRANADSLTARAWNIRKGANALRATARRYERFQQLELAL